MNNEYPLFNKFKSKQKVKNLSAFSTGYYHTTIFSFNLK